VSAVTAHGMDDRRTVGGQPPIHRTVKEAGGWGVKRRGVMLSTGLHLERKAMKDWSYTSTRRPSFVVGCGTNH
jgi:hypothetical protein